MLKKIASVLAATALLVSGVVVGANLADTPAPLRATPTAAGYTDVQYGGAIRCVNGVWGTINDSGHMSEGITSVTATSTYVQVNHVHVDKVGTAMYGWDNDYPLNGIYVTGASGGLDYDRFSFLKNGSLLNPAYACQDWTNVWVKANGYVTAP